jgi:bifunctional non-homologous end joining protein LigD
MNSPEKINLFYTEGSSDKAYQVQLAAKGAGWVVNFQFGRRGGTLKPGTKTAEPISFELAKREYDKLVREKKSKGYTEDSSGSVYQDTDAGQDFTGIIPQLLNDVREDADVEALINDKDYIAQEKFDGERRLIRLHDGHPQGINRKGIRVALPMSLASAAATVKAAQFLIDGEIIGEKYYAFDILELAGQDLRAKPLEARLALLQKTLAGVSGIQIVKTAASVAEKRALIKEVQSRRGEGVVFKRTDSHYVPGRPASGGSQRKWKFTASATLRVTSAHATKRSVALECEDGPIIVKLGNCMVPVNYAIPKAGDMVEVRYLYLYKGGSLYQPQFGGVRQDKSSPDQLASFKFKADVATDEDDAPPVAAETTANSVAAPSSKISTKKPAKR